MSVLKNKQSGSTTLINLSQAVTVTSYTPGKSILYFTFKGGDAQVDRSLVRAVKTNSTTITFYRANSTGTSPVIHWDLLEFDADTDVQDIDESGTGTQDTTITSVDLDHSFIVSSGVTNADDTFTDTTSARLALTSSTNARRVTGSTGTSGSFSYQIVEQAGTHGVSSVQYFTESAQTGTSFSQTITSITPARTIVYGSAKPNATYDYSDIFSLSLASATSVTGTRAGTASMDVGFFVVQYDTNVKVQRGSTTVGTDTDVTLTAIKLENAISCLGGAHSCGFALGYQSAETSNGDFASVEAILETTTNLNLSRMLDTTGTVTVDWQVFEADPSAVSNIVLNDTPTVGTSWGTPLQFTHTIGGNDYRILIVCVSSRGNSLADTAVSCTFNDVAMTQAATATSATSGFNVRSTIFYMLATNLPAAGTYDVEVTCSTGSPQSIEAVAYSVRGAKQQTPEATYTTGADASAMHITSNITTVTANGLTLDCLVGDNTPTAVCGTGQTLITDTLHGGTALMASIRETGLVETWPMTWDAVYTFNRWAHAVVSFEQAPTGTVENIAGSSAGSSSVSGSLPIDTALEGSSAGDATTSGTLNLCKCIRGQADGIASVEGTLTAPVRFDGVSNGVADVSGFVNVLKSLVATSDGATSFEADLRLPVPIAGQSDGVASIAADLDVIKFLNGLSAGVATVTGILRIFMAGSSHGSSSVNGDLDIQRDLRSIVGASASVTGRLTHVGKLYGTSNGVASVTGSLSTSRQNIFMSGSAAGSSLVSGPAFLVLKRLLAGIAGQASVTGTLAPQLPFEGTSNGIASITGSLSVQTALLASAAGQSTVSGALAVLTELTGGSNGVAYVSGSLYGAIKLLTATPAGQATVSGTLTILARRLAGISSGIATAQGSLLVQTSLAGLTAGIAAVEADLDAIRGIEGVANGVSAVAGTVSITRGVVATVAAAASVTGAVDVNKALRSAIAGVATVAAMLESDVPVQGSSYGLSYVNGVLNVLKSLEAASAGVAEVEAFMGVHRGLEAQADGLTDVDADMLNIVWHQGGSDGVASVSMALNVHHALEATSAGVASPSASLWVAKALLATSLGLTVPTARLSVEGYELGPAASRGRARVRGALKVIKFTSSTSLKTNPRIITRTIP